MCQPGRPGPRGSPSWARRASRRLPEGEVELIVLELGGIDAGAAEEVVDVALGEGAVTGVAEFADAVVDIAAGLVGEAFGDETLDEFDDRGDGLGHARVDVGLEDVHRLELGVIGLDVLFGEFEHRLAEAAERSMSLSSMSVKFWTCLTGMPRQSR